MSQKLSVDQPLAPRTSRGMWVLHASFLVVIAVIVGAAVLMIEHDADARARGVQQQSMVVHEQLFKAYDLLNGAIDERAGEMDDKDLTRLLEPLFDSAYIESTDAALYVVGFDGSLRSVMARSRPALVSPSEAIVNELSAQDVRVVRTLANSAFRNRGSVDFDLRVSLEREHDAVFVGFWIPEIDASLVLSSSLDGIAEYAAMSYRAPFPNFERTIYRALLVILPIIVLAYVATTVRVRRMFNELRNVTGQYQNVFHRNPSAVLLVSLATGRIRDASDAAVTFYGFPKRKLLTKSLADLQSDESAGHSNDGQPAIKRLSQGERLRIRHRCRDGSVRVVALNGTIIDVQRAGILNRDLLVTVDDVTAQHRLEQELQRVADHEKQRIGQDLHDSVGSELVGIAYMTEVLELLLRPVATEAAEQAARIASLISNAADQVKASARGLLPIRQRKGGLRSVLQGHVDNLRAKHKQPEMTLEFEGDVDTPDPTVATHVFRVIQESVNNALKYAQATTISIRLSAVDDDLIVDVSDDGRGFIVRSDADSEGLGLHIIRSRAEAVGGSVDITSQPGEGTTVRCRVPLRRPEVVVRESAAETSASLAQS